MRTPRGAARAGRPVLLTLPVWVASSMALLAGCASSPFRGADRDGPEAHPPPHLAEVPDAEPRLEAFRVGGPNKPYEIAGRTFVPMTQDVPFSERGLASWYGRKFNGKPTASGEPYDMYAMSAAHPTLPIPSYARVRNPKNGREVIVRINDRGPFSSSRIIDLSYTAAFKLDVLRGVTPVEVKRITFDDIRTGAWRRDGTNRAEADAVASTSDPSRSNPSQREPTQSEPTQSEPTRPLAAATSADAPSTAEATPSVSSASRFWVQLGAFRQRSGAEDFRQRVGETLAWLSASLSVFDDAALFRLQAGPYPSRDEARRAADRIQDGLQLTPVIVERR